MVNKPWLEYSYDAYPRLEQDFRLALDHSLEPRGPEIIYDLVKDVGLGQGARAIDVGCGEGRHTTALAERFGLRVHGIDPVKRNAELAMQELSKATTRTPSLDQRVRFVAGIAEALPIGSASADLVWCRDVLVHIQALDKAFAEMARVLCDHGHVIVYNTFATNLLEPQEAAWLWKTMGVIPSSADSARVEEAMHTAGFQIDQNIDLRSEWSERAEEESGHGTRRLLHAARLIRSPERYLHRFGKAAYDMMLGDCLWHIFRMIGKLTSRVYVLSIKDRPI